MDDKINIKEILKEKKPIIDKTIEKHIPREFTKENLEEILGKPRYKYPLEAPQKSVADPFWEFLDRGGKRWRPTMLLLVCEALGGDPKKFMDFVVIPEVIHNGCVTEDTLILDKEGVPRKVTDFEKGEKILSVGKDGTIVKRKIIETYDNGIKDVFKVKTRNREIVATENHPFLIISKEQPVRMKITEQGKHILNKKLSQLGDTVSQFCEKLYPSIKGKNSLGHMKNALYGYNHCLLPFQVVTNIAASLGMNIEKCWEKKQCKYEKAEMNLEWKKLKDLEKGDLIVVSKEIMNSKGTLPEMPRIDQNHKDRNKIPEEFSIEMAQLTGFILGDGYIDEKGRIILCIPEGNPERKQYIKLVEKIFGATPSISKDNVTICSKAIAIIFSKLGFAKHALDKEIPDWVFKLPKTHKLAFIKGYLDADGSVSKNGIVVFECANKKIITKLKVLLDTMGFVTGNIRTRKVDNQHFKKYSKKKETVLYGIGLSSKNKVLKEIGSEIEEYRNRLGVEASRSVNLRFEEQVLSFPGNMSEKEFGFNKIVKTEVVGKKHTYDLRIEGAHNYISNGIVTHNTIMIDDIEDDSDLRRGKPCSHKIFGVDVAINAGNSMYFLPFLVLRENKNLDEKTKNKVYQIMTEEMMRCHFGQAIDISWHKGLADADNISEDEYLQMCAYKTGTLARMSAKIGAVLAGADDETVEKIGKLVETTGVAFQIHDDLLNITGEKFAKGKGLGEDIHEGKRTLMVIHTLKNANEKDKKRLIEILEKHTEDEKEIKEAIEILKKYNSISYAKERAREMVREAWKEAEEILEESEAKDKLRAFANYLIEREI